MTPGVLSTEPTTNDLPPVDSRRWSWGPPFRLTEVVAISVVLAAYGSMTAHPITAGAPIGHDEAVYSLRSVAFAEGTSSVSWYCGDQRRRKRNSG